MIPLFVLAVLVATSALEPLAHAAEPKVKTLSTAEDATRNTVLIGRNLAAGMVITFELEAARSIWMQMDNPPKWRERWVRRGEIYHLDVKPADAKSKAIIPYAEVRFSGTNHTSGKRVSGTLHPVWDSGGLYYATNSALAGDGVYALNISVGMPTVGRSSQYRDQWLKPVTTQFHFRIAGGKVVEVSDPAGDS